MVPDRVFLNMKAGDVYAARIGAVLRERVLHHQGDTVRVAAAVALEGRARPHVPAVLPRVVRVDEDVALGVGLAHELRQAAELPGSTIAARVGGYQDRRLARQLVRNVDVHLEVAREVHARRPFGAVDLGQRRRLRGRGQEQAEGDRCNRENVMSISIHVRVPLESRDRAGIPISC